jgi:N-acetylglutamate synthase-like GNAT family acetyltransferase
MPGAPRWIVTVRQLLPSDAEACDVVLASLPYFFGDPDGIEACARAVRTQRGWVAEDAGEIVAFVTIEAIFPETVEITWLAVRDGRRRGGHGRALVEVVVEDAAQNGAQLVVVETLGPSVAESNVVDGYAGTRAFYARLGFLPVKEVQLRDWNDDFAILLARVVTESQSDRPQ